MATVFEWPIRVYIEDTDAGGIIFYVNYLKFMERGRTEYLRNLGFDKRYLFESGLMFVVHGLTADYKRPARLDDQLTVSTEVVQCRAASFKLRQLVCRDGELLSQDEVKIACVEKETMQPSAIPDEIRQALDDQ